MDMKKINDLMNDKFDEDDLNENDLEDELEAILSGRAMPARAAVPSRQAVPGPSRRPAPSRPEQNRPTRRAPAQPQNVYNNVGSNNNRPLPANGEFMVYVYLTWY